MVEEITLQDIFIEMNELRSEMDALKLLPIVLENGIVTNVTREKEEEEENDIWRIYYIDNEGLSYIELETKEKLNYSIIINTIEDQCEFIEELKFIIDKVFASNIKRKFFM